VLERRSRSWGWYIINSQGRCRGISRVVAGADAGKGQPRSQARLRRPWASASPLRAGVQLHFDCNTTPASPTTSRRRTHRPRPILTMALARPMPPLWQALMPALHGPVRPLVNLPLLHRLSQPFRLLPTTFAGFPLPSIALPAIPSLADIWDGLLNAVPKKKTSHMKKRHRFMAGKGIKDLINLNKCSACGRVKRAHLLCPHCVYGMWNSHFVT
jgi:large subunit ribosomal protein L32